MKNINSFFVKNNKWILILVLFFGVRILSNIIDIIISKNWHGWSLDEMSKIGDTLGGTLGLIIALFAAILTYMAFLVQYEANEQQKKYLKTERFESKFYTMLEIHRQNTSNIQIGESLSGRKTFISMFDELRTLYIIINRFLKQSENVSIIKKLNGKDSLSEKEVFNIAYLIFYYGVGQSSTKIIITILDEKYKGLLMNIEELLEKYKSVWRTHTEINIEEQTHKGDGYFNLKIPYEPFNGHISILSNYIRHLFQLVKFIHEQEEPLISYDKKYEYIATIRSQLSSHEQLFLYYNSLSILGDAWCKKEDNIIEKYCVLRNIPLPLADFYKKPTEVFAKKNTHNKNMFEWSEIEDKITNIGLE